MEVTQEMRYEAVMTGYTDLTGHRIKSSELIRRATGRTIRTVRWKMDPGRMHRLS